MCIRDSYNSYFKKAGQSIVDRNNAAVDVGSLLVLVGGAGSQAHAAAQAVIGRDLHTEGVGGGVLAQALGGHGDEGFRRTGLLLLRCLLYTS